MHLDRTPLISEGEFGRKLIDQAQGKETPAKAPYGKMGSMQHVSDLGGPRGRVARRRGMETANDPEAQGARIRAAQKASFGKTRPIEQAPAVPSFGR